jgi:hypothetical protein
MSKRGKESFTSQMAIFMKEILSRTVFTVEEGTLLVVVILIRVNSNMERWRAMANLLML